MILFFDLSNSLLMNFNHLLNFNLQIYLFLSQTFIPLGHQTVNKFQLKTLPPKLTFFLLQTISLVLQISQPSFQHINLLSQSLLKTILLLLLLLQNLPKLLNHFLILPVLLITQKLLLIFLLSNCLQMKLLQLINPDPGLLIFLLELQNDHFLLFVQSLQIADPFLELQNQVCIFSISKIIYHYKISTRFEPILKE